MLKATAGGGGKGMRLCWNDEELSDGWSSAKNEAAAAFGNDGMYMEKFIEEPRHIEIQITADQYGKVCHLSEEIVPFKRTQKLVEETPSPFMTSPPRKNGRSCKKSCKSNQL